MELKYFGNCAFEWVTEAGYKILIDPFRNSSWSSWFRTRMPRIKVDVILVSHPHFDHNATSELLGEPQIITQPGRYQGPDIIVQGIAGRHARPRWHSWWHRQFFGYRNTIFVLETEGLRFCHWGDNNADVNKKLRQSLGQIDVLMLPIDESEHLLSMTEVDAVIKALAPKIIIPMHYRIQGLSSDSCPLKPINHWLTKQHRIRRVPSSGISLHSEDIRELPHEVWVFQPFLFSEQG